MTRWTIRRAAVPPQAGHRAARHTAARPLAGVVLAAAGLLLAGCSVGQIAETARKSPSVPGANADRQLRDADGNVIGSVAVRDVLVAYKDPTGYERGADAPLEARIFNDTRQAVTVRVTVAEPEGGDGGGSAQIVEAASVTLVDAATPAVSPTGSADATTNPEATSSPGSTGTPGGPDQTGARPAPVASLEIPAGGFAALTRSGGRYLELTGLRERLAPGMSVPLRFAFSNGLELYVTASVGVPLSPPERATPDTGAEEEH